MLKYVVVVLGLTLSALFAIHRTVGVSSVYNEYAATPRALPHVFEDPSEHLSVIHATVVYFVPRDRTAVSLNEWRPVATQTLDALAAFHYQQFTQTSTLTYTIHPTPLIGERDGIDYDTTNTQGGNPAALEAVTKEVERRIQRNRDDVFPVTVIIYEGVGAAGAKQAALLSRQFLTDSQYQHLGASILGHEFYHTIGAPEGYQVSDGSPLTTDIMGQGRFRPLNETYVSDQLRAGFGL